jgi:hypothetical protein
LFQPVDKTLNLVARSIALLVESTLLRLISATGNDGLNASTVQVAPDLVAEVSLVTDHPLWTQTWPSTSCTLDRPTFHERLEHLLLVALPSGDQKGERLAASLSP